MAELKKSCLTQPPAGRMVKVPMETRAEQLEQRLEVLTADRRWEGEPKKVHGSSVLKGSRLDLGEIPDDHKLLVRITGEPGVTRTYYTDTEGYDPKPFYMPSGSTVLDEEYEVRGIYNTSNGLEVDSSRGIFFVSSLEGLEFIVREKDIQEKTNELLRGKRFGRYEYVQAKVKEMKAEAAELRKLACELPDLPVDGPLRYSIDCRNGITIYHVDPDGARHATEYRPIQNPLNGKFHGNRFTWTSERLFLVDDEYGLAAGGVLELEKDRYWGFGFVTVVDREADFHERKPVNQKLAVSFTETTS